jgi:hypothetical protein
MLGATDMKMGQFGKLNEQAKTLSTITTTTTMMMMMMAVITLCDRRFQLLNLRFYIHGFVHRDSILIRSNEMQQYAGVYLLENYSTCFGCLSHPSSGVHQTVNAASGTAWPN